MDPKAQAAEAAVDLLHDGMLVGLGSGTTAAFAVQAIGRRGLKITGIATSEKTAALARSLGIPLRELSADTRIEVTIDGADEIEEGSLDLVKGRGGALLREKIVASATDRLVIIADDSKVVTRLSAEERPIPVEVVTFAWETTARRLEALGARPQLRAGFTTDGGHYILDCLFPQMDDARRLARELDAVVGVVEHGLFIGMASDAIVASGESVRVLRRATGRPSA
jgi:ribose 5-phosphate isomerase A